MNFDWIAHQRAENEAENRVSPKTSRPENIERPDGYDRHTHLAVIRFHQMFPCQFGDGIAPSCLGGWADRGRGVFINAEGVHAKNFACRKIDKTLEAYTLFQRLEDARRSDEISFECLPWVTANSTNAHDGRGMNHDIRLLCQVRDLGSFEDVSLNHAHVTIAA